MLDALKITSRIAAGPVVMIGGALVLYYGIIWLIFFIENLHLPLPPLM